MQFGKSVAIACSSFAITNVDDMFVLVTFFAEASTSKTITPLKITLGQYIGFTAIVIISMIGFGVSIVLPSEPIGFLGLLPILLGVWKLFELLLPTEEEEPDKSNFAGVKSVLKVSTVTLMNGGDNIGTYVPLFSQTKGAEIAVYVVIYYILLGVWCLVAFLVMRQKHILLVVRRYMRVVIPLLYVGLGVYIVVKSSCYPWSIHRINVSASAHPGKTIMAVATTVLLLTCIGAMLWFRLRKKAPPTSDVNVSLEGNLSSTPEDAVDGSHTPAPDVNISLEENLSPTPEGAVDGDVNISPEENLSLTPEGAVDGDVNISLEKNLSPTPEGAVDGSHTPTPDVNISLEGNSSPTLGGAVDGSHTLA